MVALRSILISIFQREEDFFSIPVQDCQCCDSFFCSALYNKADLATSNTNSFRTSKLIRNAI